MLAVAAAEVSAYIYILHIIFSYLMERNSATLQDSIFPRCYMLYLVCDVTTRVQT